MPIYNYEAKNQNSEIVKGKIELKNEKAFNTYIKEQDLTLDTVNVVQTKSDSKLKTFLDRFGRIPTTQKIFFIHHLEVMLRSGFSITRALGVIGEQTNSKKLKSIVLDVKSQVEKGVNFSKALEKYKKVFSELFINMIASGEVSGKLDEVLKRLATQLRKDHALIAKIRGALTYPVIVVVAMIAVGVTTMIFVIPQLTTVFEESGTELPMITKILLGVSGFVVNQGLWLVIGLAVIVFLFFRIIKTYKGKYYFHKILLKSPIISPIIKKLNLARFSRSLNALLKTDIPIIKTFEIIAKTLGNVHYQKAVKESTELLKTGSTVQKCLEKWPQLFTPVIIQMVAVGEESGTLDDISEEIADFYEEEIDQTMSNLSTIIEPILMLLLGVGVAGMAAAIILPIYSLSEAF